MKHFQKKLILVIIYSILLINSTISLKNFRTNKATCSISTISIPIGTNSPVMVYNARLENESLRLTVLDKDQSSKYKVEGSLFFTDKETGESWYTEKNIDEKNLETMRDAFSMCRTLNDDNKATHNFEKNQIYEQFRTDRLPENLTLRISTDNNMRTSSFLQMKTKLKLKLEDDDEVKEEEVDRTLDQLETDENDDLTAEQFSELNNNAHIDNEELQQELYKIENDQSDEVHSNDLYMD